MMRAIALVAVALACAGPPATALAQEPSTNISSSRHGNMAAAQDLIRQAYDRMTAAQQANEFDLGGHASKAKDLLRQASDEIRLAADVANQHR